MNKILYAILLLNSLSTMAQTFKEDRNTITIKGKIADKVIDLINKAPYISFYNDYNQEDPSLKQVIPLNIMNGQFAVKIIPEGELAYFDLGDGIIRSISNDEFLVEKGDSLFLDIRDKDDVFFMGRGAEKMNYQNWAGKFIWSDSKNWTPQDKMEEIMSYNKKRATKFMAVTLDVLNKDTSITSSNIKNLLRLNVASSISKQYLNSITNDVYFADSIYFGMLKKEVNFLITQQNGFVVTDDYLIKNSFMYLQYLFDLNKAIAVIKTKSWKTPVEIIYNNIKSQFKGLLRDKLLPYCFLNILKTDGDGVRFLPEALSLVEDSSSKEILKKIEIAKQPGVKAYNFSIEDLNRKLIKLDDFKGKLIILETYYAGCFPCRQLSIQMEPIAEYFENRKDVVFISMDGVAKDFKTFEKGAKSGKYGYKQSIYAWTDGQGERHPMLLYYQYFSFPNLLVIGKDGNVISANPDKPFDEISKNNFISFIANNL